MELTREEIYNRHLAYSTELVSLSARAVDFLDIAPRKLDVQISLVDYFERVKRYKADRWQRDFCDRLQYAAENRHIKRYWGLFHAEGQLGKTTILSQIFIAWLMGSDPLFRFALAMYNTEQSEKHSKVVIQILNSPLHKDIFPNKDGWLDSAKPAQSGWMTRARRELNDGQFSLNPVGLISGLTGSGYDWLSIDDPYRNQKDAFSETINQGMREFYDFTVLSRTGLHSCITGMFHRYAPEDFAGYLLDTGDFDYVRYATVADGDYVHSETGIRYQDPLNRQLGEYISPERRPPAYYEKVRKNNRVWLSMFQGVPSSEEGDFFNVGKIATISPEEGMARRSECLVLIRAWDLAATHEGGDYSVGVLMGLRPDGQVTVFEVIRRQVDAAGRDALQTETAERDGFDVVITVPEDPGAAGKTTSLHIKNLLKSYQVVIRSTTGSKEDRARNYSSAVNSGDVEFVSDEYLPDEDTSSGPTKWIKTTKKEMRDFPLSEHKDIVDASADGYNEGYERVIKGSVIKNFKPQRNLALSSQFFRRFPFYENDRPRLKIPANFTVYVGVKISADASRPTSAVMCARFPENSNLREHLLVFAEYKENDSNFYALFDWIERTLQKMCIGRDKSNTVIWIHPNSEQFVTTIRTKLKYGVRLFEENVFAGITETNWYMLPTPGTHPFNDVEQGTRLMLLVADSQFEKATDNNGLYAARQEINTWNYNDRGEPSAIGSVMDCLRMITFAFRTNAVKLTQYERAVKIIEQTAPTLSVEEIDRTEDEQLKQQKRLQRSIKMDKIMNDLDKPRRSDDEFTNWLDQQGEI